jgi:hypothetical protein
VAADVEHFQIRNFAAASSPSVSGPASSHQYHSGNGLTVGLQGAISLHDMTCAVSCHVNGGSYWFIAHAGY